MITLIVGTMKSGKSTKLFNTADSLQMRPYPFGDFALVAPSVSKRKFFARGVENNFVVYDESFDYSKCKTLLIDEIQFFSKEYIQDIINNRKDHTFIIAGLLSDKENKMWENVVMLLPYADNVELRYANCDICGCNNAKYHIGSGLIGDDYLVVCERCKE